MEYKFDVEFLEPAREFLEQVNPKARNKIYYNIWKSRLLNEINHSHENLYVRRTYRQAHREERNT